MQLRRWLKRPLAYVAFAAGFACYIMMTFVVLWIFFVGPVVLWEESRLIISLEAIWILVSLPIFLWVLVKGVDAVLA